MTNDQPKKYAWYKHWWGVILIIVLALLALGLVYFGYQFFHYYKLAKTGELSSAELAFTQQFSTTDSLRKKFYNTPETAVDVQTSDDPRLGNPDASLVIVEFADFGCPWSKTESSIIRELMAEHANEVLLIYRDFPLDEIHPGSKLAAEASECANELGNFWAFHDKIYQGEGKLGRDDLISYAREVGLPEEKFTTCLDSGKYASEVQEDLEAGVAAGVRGTPTFFLNNRRVEGSIPKDIFKLIIEAVVSGQ